jgi:stress response protein YsnF
MDDTRPRNEIAADETDTRTRRDEIDDEATLQLREETLQARVVDREKGKVLVHKRVETTPVSEDVTLRQGRVDIERIARNELVEERLDPWYEGELLMIPVYEEVPVTEIRLVLKEIVQIRQGETTEQVTVEGETRREVVDIERTGEA